MKNQGRRIWPQISLMDADQGRRKLLYQRRFAQSAAKNSYSLPCCLKNRSQKNSGRRSRRLTLIKAEESSYISVKISAISGKNVFVF